MSLRWLLEKGRGRLERDAGAVGDEGGEKAARSAMGAVVLGIGLGRAELCWNGLSASCLLVRGDAKRKYHS